MGEILIEPLCLGNVKEFRDSVYGICGKCHFKSICKGMIIGKGLRIKVSR